jgi:hypothetical protein
VTGGDSDLDGLVDGGPILKTVFDLKEDPLLPRLRPAKVLEFCFLLTPRETE